MCKCGTLVVPAEKARDIASVCAPAREHLSQDAIRSGVELDLKFSGGASSLFHQRRIEQQCDAIHERA
jgi:hypothetical protein